VEYDTPGIAVSLFAGLSKVEGCVQSSANSQYRSYSGNAVRNQGRLMERIHIRYGSRSGLMAFLGVFFVILTLLVAYATVTGHGRQHIPNIIPWSTYRAETMYCAAMTLICAGFAGVCVYAVILALAVERWVTITDTHLSTPGYGLALTNAVIPLPQIREVVVTRFMRGLRILYIHHSRGRFGIPEINLPNAAAFDAVYKALSERTRAS
jgi:hypothetical protein